MRVLVIIAVAATLLTGCEKQVLGQSTTECERHPEKCASVREAHAQSSGLVTPRPSDTALQRGDVMRVWVAPMRTSKGVLTNSGHVYLD